MTANYSSRALPDGGKSPPDLVPKPYVQPFPPAGGTPYRITRFLWDYAGAILLHGRGDPGNLLGTTDPTTIADRQHFPLIDLNSTAWNVPNPLPTSVIVDHNWANQLEVPAADGSTDPGGVDGVTLNILRHQHVIELSTPDLELIKSGVTLVKRTAPQQFDAEPQWLINGQVVLGDPIGYINEPRHWRLHSHLVAFSRDGLWPNWDRDGFGDGLIDPYGFSP